MHIIFRSLDLAILQIISSISGLVVEYIVAIDVTRVQFPADAISVGIAQAVASRA